MIPKIIHYCWFGGQEKPKKLLRRLEQWRAVLVGYQFYEWNEGSFDLSSAPAYVHEAYDSKKWAFVSDYVRFWALIRFGGVYLDTDVDVLKPFDQFLNEAFFLSQESENSLCTAILGCVPNHRLARLFLDTYNDDHFIPTEDPIPNSVRLKSFLEETLKVSICFDEELSLTELHIFPLTVFGAKDIHTHAKRLSDRTIAIHNLDASWYGPLHRFLHKMKALIMGFINFFIRTKK